MPAPCGGDIWNVDEVFITIRGKRGYLWRAVDQDGDVSVLKRERRDAKAYYYAIHEYRY